MKGESHLPSNISIFNLKRILKVIHLRLWLCKIPFCSTPRSADLAMSAAHLASFPSTVNRCSCCGEHEHEGTTDNTSLSMTMLHLGFSTMPLPFWTFKVILIGICVFILPVIRATDCRCPIAVRKWCNCLYSHVQSQFCFCYIWERSYFCNHVRFDLLCTLREKG